VGDECATTAFVRISSQKRDFVRTASSTRHKVFQRMRTESEARNATLNLGVRFDHYDGLTAATLVERRLGVSYSTTR
jgi:hypothetical protein